jgi:hypothetical protein
MDKSDHKCQVREDKNMWSKTTGSATQKYFSPNPQRLHTHLRNICPELRKVENVWFYGKLHNRKLEASQAVGIILAYSS